MVTDALRWLVIAEAAFLFGFAIAIMMEARKFRAPPRHVWWIATSYIVLVVGYAIEVWARLGEPVGHRWAVPLVAFTFGIVAMFEMWRAYQYAERVARHARIANEAALRLLGDVERQKREG